MPHSQEPQRHDGATPSARSEHSRRSVKLPIPQTEGHILISLTCLAGSWLLLRHIGCKDEWWATSIEFIAAAYALAVTSILGATAVVAAARTFVHEWRNLCASCYRK